MKLKVISDNGYVMQLIRPMKGISVIPGVEVEVKMVGQVDLVRVYDNFLDEETRKRIMSEIRDSVGGNGKRGRGRPAVK